MIYPRGEAKEGVVVICTVAASPFYTKGKLYKIQKNEKGELCLLANDSLYDPITLLQSSFILHNKK